VTYVNQFPLPDPIPRAAADPVDLAGVSLSLYRKISGLNRLAEEAIANAELRIQSHTLATSRTIAALAAEHFEFDRVMKRIQPELEKAGANSVKRVLEVFGRGWAAVLAREEVELRDLTNVPFSNEIAEVVEVNGSVADPAASEPVVRETLTPLVLHRGQIISRAIVNKSVPVSGANTNDLENPS
jgi:hypothetical protein